ncbi:MAG: AarF/UbiB family protein [Polyangiaceae bacterium]|nr:AarF/UbiB family protein [Polyangiaceae bacterium]
MVSFVSAARDISRLREVSSVLIRHGFGQVVSRIGLPSRPEPSAETGPDAASNAQSTAGDDTRGKSRGKPSTAARIRLVLEELGPTFVKLGQLASTRPDLLPADLIFELRKLQDSLPPLPYAEVRQQLESSLSLPIEELFASIDEQPLAAASIAQVHRAKLNVASPAAPGDSPAAPGDSPASPGDSPAPDLESEAGTIDVALKVQRPGIAKTIASDLDFLHTLAALLEKAVPETRIYSPVGLVRQFDQAITAELDFIQEAENARRFAQNFNENPQVRFPAIYAHASSKTVICMEFMPGIKVNSALERGHDGREIARLAYRTMIKQIYEDGFFHADPHPGNVLIHGQAGEPILSMIDLGMVGRLSPRMRDLTIDVVIAALRQDYDAIAQALYEIGTPTKKIDREAFRAEVTMLCERYIGKSLEDVELSAMIRDLVSGALKFGLEIPTDFVLMGKSLMTIEGIGKEIDPGFDVYEESRPLFTELLKKRYSPERMGNELLRRIERLGNAGYNVPQQVEEVLDDLRLGRLHIHTNDLQKSRTLRLLGLRLSTAILMGFLLLSASLLLTAGHTLPSYLLFAIAGLLALQLMAVEIWAMLRPPK